MNKEDGGWIGGASFVSNKFDSVVRLVSRVFQRINPNTAGLFEGSFSWVAGGGGQYDPPLHISRRTYPISIKLYTIIKQYILFVFMTYWI